MLFEVENIGKVKYGRLKMRGITVLAGNNSTGKSTFGKALFCMFNAFRESDKTIMRERRNSIVDIIFRFNRRPIMRPARIDDLADSILDKMDYPPEIQKIIQDAIEQRIIIPREIDDSANMLFKKICDYGRINDKQIQKMILEQYLTGEFDGQVTHVNSSQQKGTMSLLFKDQQYNLAAYMNKNECIDYTDNVSILNRAFYVDTPFIMDVFNQYKFRPHPNEYNHRNQLLECLRSTNNDSNISEKVISKESLKSVLEHINSTVPGDFDKTESGNLGFREPGLDQPLELANVSAGMKMFLIIKRLLETGAIKERDVLILDEPEVHLHPEWQIKFAEALVLLQKAFDLTILLTTHSPYFLRAVEVFSIKQGNANDRCDYYHLKNNEEGYCHAQDVMADTDEIYQTLAKPFQTLDSIYYANCIG